MDATEATAEAKHVELVAKLDAVSLLIGKPSDGAGRPASGLYHMAENLDKRLQPFEKLRERVWGGILVGGPAIALVWWLGGDKIARIFHG